MEKLLFTPIKIGNCTVKNRIVMAPMLMGFGQIDGTPTESLMDYYEERAKGGTGLIITEITRVNDVHGAAAFAQLAMSHDYHIEPMREFAERIHRHGAKIFVQLHHPGRQNVGLMVGTVPMSIATERIWPGYRKFLYKIVPFMRKALLEKNRVPCSVAPSKVEPSKFAEGRVRALRKSEIKKLVRQFIEAAVRCKKAGVDGVELHATHGYLIQQFLSPHTNRRTDEYGGSFENRLRFLTEILTGIKEKCGDFPVIVRLTVDEFYDKVGRENTGYGIETGVAYAKAIEKAGADAIDVSSASYDAFNYWLEPVSFPSGWRKNLAEAVKKEVGIPVIAADIIRTPDFAESLLREGVQDMASLGRPHIADPHWAKKAEEGRAEDIKRCISCLYCIESMQENAFVGTHGRCSVNPALGREKEIYNSLSRDGEGRTVAIVGAGCAGLTAAEILLKRGFRAVILEKASVPGGQINDAAALPCKEKIYWCIEDLVHSVIKLGGEIRYNTEATAETVKSLHPYAVIVATGALPVRPESFYGENVFTSSDVLEGKIKFENKKLVLIGSGMTGLECAELASENNSVTVVEMEDEIAKGTWFQHVDEVMPKLTENGVRFLLSHKLVTVGENYAETVPVRKKKGKFTENGDKERIECDAVILSMGARPVNGLYEELKGSVERLYKIGDAVSVGRIAEATADGFRVGMSIK